MKQTLIPALLLGLIAQSASASSIYNESIDGDLSGVFSAPDLLPITTGVNTLIGTTGANGGTGATDGSDADYFTITIPAGKELTTITLDSYVANPAITSQSFIGYVNAAAFTGQGGGDIDDNELFGTADLGNPNLINAITGQSSLGPGDHSFWIQEIATTVIDYQFSVTVVPEPVSAGLGLLGLAIVAGRRRR
ncbi:MAG: hypothetical protein AAGA92_05695 [Planctomycetota bacterium]